MTARQFTLLSAVASVLLVTGCGSMMIETNRADAAIYLDGQRVGTGRADVSAMGLPKTSKVRVEHNGEVIVRTVKRHFTVTTFVAGLFSYATGWVWGWQYPDHVYVTLSSEAAARDPWSAAGSNVWGRPMYSPPGARETAPQTTDATSVKADPATPRVTPQPKPARDPWAKP